MVINECDRQTAGETIEALQVVWEQGPKSTTLTHRQLMRLTDLIAALRDAERRLPCPKTHCLAPPKPD